ncbi:3734_t:CDS:2 [Scutellospora calospora]|uniref:3734_t:CDS:1 n=1 Tax=Scutellospora calospora TaxID=85575 RepID=A0ACA9KCQ0_9GLOM|nr:3734_t:CDS:2 [Scutellospora calospora]
MDSQESSSSFQKNTYNDKSDSDNNENNIAPLTNILTSNKNKRKSKLSFQKQQTTLLEMVKANTPHKGDRRKEIIRGVVE